MDKLNYTSKLDLLETEIAIKYIKDTFERDFSQALCLTRVSAPIIVCPESGLNDNLSGDEKPVSFVIKKINKRVEIVQSLAKWKRMALKKYNFKENFGLYTDMNAIRSDDKLDELHSIYVDQWDWEKIISNDERNLDYLKQIVSDIYKVILKLNNKINDKYPMLHHNLPNEIFFISTTELQKLYPNLSSKERENEITKKYGAVFLYQIGWPLSDGNPHDGRAADYDDWLLNGDILLWYDVLDLAMEISSMGIRVNKDTIIKQLEAKNELFKLNNPYVQAVINEEMPLTVGGGIGQSRLCMYFLKKAHIGEVQASIWDEQDIENLKKRNINLL